MEHQVKIVAKAAFYHLRLIARIRRFLNQSAAKAKRFRNVDYCNSLFSGLPEKTTTCLQRVQNAAPDSFFAEAGARAPAHPSKN